MDGEGRARGLVEIAVVFAAAVIVVAVGWRLVGPGPLARQAVVWVANVVMLLVLWASLRTRGEGWAEIGLRLRRPSLRGILTTVAWSFPIALGAAVAFILGSAVAAPLAAGAPADMSGYNALAGNLPLLLAALAAVYIVSSFGEEVVYRGFLITRLEEAVGGGSDPRASGRPATILAVVGSSVMFGLVHFDWGLVGVVQTTFMGLALGVAFLLVKRNLWPLILAHAYLDTLLLVQQYLQPAAGAGP